MQGYATLPDGSKQWLLKIKNWDFRWQGDYRYEEPLRLPAGTSLHLQYTYDNSTNNVRNPNAPPRLVQYGAQSTDEMCELWLQLLADSAQDLEEMKKASDAHVRQMFFDYYNFRLKGDSNDPLALTRLGTSLMNEKKFAEAAAHFQRAIQADPKFDQAYFELGVLYRLTKRRQDSKAALETSLRLNPDNSKAWGHLGFLFAELGNAEEAERCFRKALELDPLDKMVQKSLDELAVYRKRKGGQ